MTGERSRAGRRTAGRWVSGVLTGALVAGLLAPASALAAPGDLDASFGTLGVVVSSFGSSDGRATAMVLQPDGKIVLGGTAFPPGQTLLTIARLDASGGLDASFGSGGTVSPVINGAENGVAVLLQPDGKIIAVGQTASMGSRALVLVRMNPDGSLDPSFGSGGIVLSTIGPASPPNTGLSIYDGLLQPDGKIVVIGFAGQPSSMFSLARFEPDGSVDTGFGVGGEVFTPIGSSNADALAAALQPDGRIVVVGTRFFQSVVTRYEPDGSLDAGFGTAGIVTAAEPLFTRAVALQPDGKIVVAGDDNDGTPSASDFNFKLRRLNPDGSNDVTFNGGVPVTTAIGPSDDLALDVLVQPSGRIVVAGYTTTFAFLQTARFAVTRYLTDGSLDPGFGSGGIVTTELAGLARDTGAAVAVQPDSRILVAGEHFFPTSQFAVARYFGNICGNGTLEAGEDCDDGNTIAGDCCDANCHFEPVDTPCTDDADLCTTDTCNSVGICQHTGCSLCERCDAGVGCVEGPRPSCAPPGLHGRASLLLKDETPDNADLARWRWRSETVPGGFGDPTQDDDYALCIYTGTAQALWLMAEAPAGGSCADRPCWTGLGSPPLSEGAQYRDHERTPDGIASILLSSHPPRPRRIVVRGKGPLLGLPPLGSLALPVRVQLQRPGSACWEATFANPRMSTSARFQATMR